MHPLTPICPLTFRPFLCSNVQASHPDCYNAVRAKSAMNAVRKELKMGENIEGLEPRVVRLETNIAHLVAQNTDIKADLRALSTKIDQKFDKIDEKFARVDEK